MQKKEKKYYLFEISVFWLNVICTVLLVGLFVFSWFLLPEFVSNIMSHIQLALFIFIYLFYMGLHEVVHSIGYVLYGGDFKKIVYGVQLESGVFYCLCKQNISRRNILHSLLFPFFYLGIIPYILGICFHNYYLFVLAIFNLAGCAGDIVMFLFIVRLRNIEFTELDNPMQFALYSESDVSRYIHFGLKYVGCEKNVSRNDLQKVRISKFSYVLLGLIFSWCLVFEFLAR